MKKWLLVEYILAGKLEVFIFHPKKKKRENQENGLSRFSNSPPQKEGVRVG